jgi:hypothetical protein
MLCLLGLVLLVLPTTRHIKVVRVVTTGSNDAPHATIERANGAPAAPLAPTPQEAASAGTNGAAASAGTQGAPAITSEAQRVLPSDASASFEQLAATLPGRIELAVSPLGEGGTTILGADAPAHGWSTTKVPVLVSLLKARGTSGLTENESVLAHSAITESNNESILALFGDLEQIEGGLGGASSSIQQLFRQSGDDETVVTTAPPPPGAVTTFGQTEWRPSEAVKFFGALARGCLLPADQSRYVLNLMSNIEPTESWGLGSAGFSSVAFKGGWGPESGGYLVRQSGIIDPGSSSGAAVAIVAFAPSFSVGTDMLTRTASWLDHNLTLSPHPSARCSATE